MTKQYSFSKSLPRQATILILASAIGLPIWAQQTQAPPATTDQSAPSSMSADQPSQPSPSAQQPPAKEGFWGRMNPMARKKWVKKQLDPINDRLSELDQVNAKNAADIKDVDSRAQAGIQKAQAAADQANQTAMAATESAKNANNSAMQASNHVNSIHSTVNGLDQYKQVTDFDVTFRPGTTTISDDSKQKLDQLAQSLTGRQGYILEMSAQSPGAGSVGIQNSQRLAESVKRYLVTDHQIPVFRMHSVALGNVQVASNDQPADQENAKPAHVRTPRTVHVRLMENSLAAQGAGSPQGTTPSTGTVQP
jgi:outer membrane protein OmpA-like peptidoglycan-associated protein